jgi:PAS domain S-box-containing protein
MIKFKLKVYDFLRKTFKLNDLSQIENEKPKSLILKNISGLNSEHPFYELFENVNLIAVFLDLKGKVVYCNSYMSTLTGYGQEELIGSDWFGLMVPEAVPETKEVFLKGLKTGKIANHFENPILTKSGKQYDIFWNNTILRDTSGSITGTASIGENITERKVAEKREKEYALNLSNILESVSDAFVSLDTQWCYTYMNKKAGELFGRNPQEMIGKHIWTEFPEGVGQVFYHAYYKAVETQEFQFLEEYYPPYGLWFENRIYPSKEGLSIFFHDITNRKRAELALYESEEKYRSIYENSSVAILFSTTDGVILSANDFACKIFEGSEDEIREAGRKGVLDITDQRLPGFLAERERTGQANGELTLLKKDGTKFPGEISSVIFKDKEENERTSIVIRDLTEQKQVEEENRLKNAELQTLNRIILKTNEAMSLQSRLESIMDEVLQIVGLEGGTICLINPDDTFELAVQREASDETIHDFTTNRIKIGDCLCGNCALDCRPLILNTREEVLNYATREVLQGEDIRFHAAMPFLVGENCVGVLCVFTRTDKKPTKNSLKLLETVCAQISLSIKNARLYDELNESEELFRLSTELVNVAVWEFDLTTNSMTRSKNHDNLYGLEVQDKWAFETFLNATHPDDREMSNSFIQNAVAPGGTDKYRFDFRVIYPDQSIHWLNVTGEVIRRNEKGEGVLIRGFIIDITDRKRAEEAVRNSEERFRNAFENIPDVIVIYDRNLKIQHINAATLRITGRPVSFFIGKSDDEIWPPEVFQAYLPALEKALKSGKICSVETKLVLKKNGTQYLRITCIPILDESGNVHEIMGITHDFTRRKQAEENIQTERDFSNALLDGLPGIFYFYDSDFKFLRWNKNFETVSGYSGNEIANMGPLDFFSDNEKDLLKEKIGEVFTKGFSKVEADFLSKNGTRTPYFFNGLKIKYKNKDCLIGIGIDITERKKAEAAVRESGELYRTIISNIPGGLIHIFDRDMRYVFNAGEELARLGLSNEYLVGKSIHEVLSTDLAPIVESQYKRVLAGETVRFEGGYGEEYFSLTSAPLRNTDGEVENILTLSVNITERKQTEQNLAKSEKRYRSLFENMNSGFVLFEVVQNEQGIPVDLIVIAANEGFGKTTGLKLRDSIGMNLTQVLPGIEKDEADWIGTYSRVALSGKSIQFEQGSELLGVYYSISAFQSGPKQCAVTFVDITERKQAEKALRQSEEKFNKAFYNSPDAITITRASDGELIEVNEAFCKLSGFSRESVIGNSTILLNLWYDINNCVKYIDHLKVNGSIKDFEAKFVTSEGMVRDFLVSGEMFILNNETCVLGILRDVTDLKITQNELDTLNRELELRIRERTAQLESANKELESFSYSISHDLRAPLRAIYGFSQILAGRHRESLNEEGKKYMDYIVESSVRMEQLINDLLNYSRLGRKTVEIRPVSLKKIIDAIFDDYKPQIHEIGGKFQVPGNPPEILSDESLLRQIFSNLIGNSIKYRRNDADLSIIINFEIIQNNVIIKVADNGIGIAAEHYEKIFNVFQRLHSEDKYPGTGIGLANVKKAVSMLGGTISVESTIGKGSTFILKFRQYKKEIK